MPVALLFTDNKNITQDYIDRLAEKYDFFEDEEEFFSYTLLKIKWLNNNGLYPLYCDYYDDDSFFPLYHALVSEEKGNRDYFIVPISNEPIKQREIDMIMTGYKDEYRGIRNYYTRMQKYLETHFDIPNTEHGREDDSVDIVYKVFINIERIFKQRDLVDRLFKNENVINNKKLIINEAEDILNSDNNQ